MAFPVSGAAGISAGAVPGARERAAALVPDERLLVGPLKGYHHETYAFPLPATGGSGVQSWWKCRDPRAGLFWFDLRWFSSEKELVRALAGRITRIPAVVDRESVSLYTFIEGRTLGELSPPGRPLSWHHEHQIGVLFRELASVGIDEIEEGCGPGRPDGRRDDSAAFLARLIDFTERHVYRRHLPGYGALFSGLGIRGDSLERLRKQARQLTPRPYVLVHGDLHRENFIVDRRGDLWTIDWELAMIGDPLYDLATHLHLMRYPSDERERITGIWLSEVERARPGSSEGWEHDLPVLLGYKRAQSVYTDVIRTALSLSEGPGSDRQLSPASRRIQETVAAAQAPLGLGRVPTVREVVAAYRRWLCCRPPGATASAP
ncbi:aminoglycoside phosphotransferase family protein [Streptomyces sp. NBC_00464]|uniref:phosphotransferase n=1 Tax=Streptomyces sp. NBC_00464 TaxID=2975751 RepID=UPI002E18520F